jgi:Fe-S cluster biogenesis protein NfuA
MTSDSIRITAEPQTNTSCRFVVDRPLYPNASYYFATKERAQESALARRIFDLEEVTSVLLSHDQVTVGQSGFSDWRTIGPRIGAAIREHLASGEPAVSEQLRESLPPAEVIRQRVQDVLDAEVNPAVGQHGGFVRLVDVRENAIFLQLGGGCQGCGMAKMTLRNGVETAIRRGVPEVGAIFDATDHASGRNPYYASSGH